MGMKIGKGWRGESYRHSLARKGIRTGRINPTNIKQNIILSKKEKEKTKERIIDALMNDTSLEEQEMILKSKSSEMDEDYLERLDNKLWNSSLLSLERTYERIFGEKYSEE